MKVKTSLITAWLLVIIALPMLTSAQNLNEEQYQALQNDILVTHAAEFSHDVAIANYGKIAEAYNLQASPVYWLWKNVITPKQIYQSVVEGQKWSWATYKAQTLQERDSWRDMMQPNELDPSLQQTRDGFTAIFGGQGASAVQVNYLLALSRRQALRGEALFAVATEGGTGTRGSTANPDTLTHAGQVTYNDIYYALTGVRP